jgi:ApbE superfamily uncharacterized protein (UPF0280 family)
MKTDKYQRRFYRDWVGAKDLYLSRVSLCETDLQILTDKPVDKNSLEQKIRLYRGDIENYIAKDRRFLTALKPIEVELNAKPIVRKMSRAAKIAGVGPMATVAGAIAQFLGKDLLKAGYKDVIIENGGDIFLATRKARTIGIYAGRRKLWNRLCLKIKPEDTPMGICTSSGTLGHSLSFGYADSIVILSKDTSLADAVATACANRVKSPRTLRDALDFAKSIRGVSGVVIVLGKNLISWGKVKFAV